MNRRTTRIQLVVFTVVAVAAVVYGTVRYLGVGALIDPPTRVSAEFVSAGGVYPGADVTLNGVSVGRVGAVEAGPGALTTVTLELDTSHRVPADVSAAVRNASAIGEQYVDLTPAKGVGRLGAGDRIPAERTSAPVDTGVLLSNVDRLVASIPADDLGTVIDEGSTALDGRGAAIGSLIESSDRLSARLLDDVDSITALIDDAAVVLDTQRDLGPRTATSLRALGKFTSTLAADSPRLARLFSTGTSAAAQLDGLVQDNRTTLPALTSNLLPLVDVADRHNLGLRKVLISFPWVLEYVGTMIRHCGEYDPRTGAPIESTCRYDTKGRPIYSGYLGLQLPQLPGTAPFFPCTKGYDGTVKYLPNGRSLKDGSPQPADAQPNFEARCTASPYDPNTPNVRGEQNVPRK